MAFLQLPEWHASKHAIFWLFFTLSFFFFFFNAEDEHGRSTPLPSLEIESVKTEDVEAALKHTKPSARQLKDKYNDWQREYESV